MPLVLIGTRLEYASDSSRRCGVKRTTYTICDTGDDHSTINHWNKRIESRNSVDLKDNFGKIGHLIHEIPSNLSQ